MREQTDQVKARRARLTAEQSDPRRWCTGLGSNPTSLLDRLLHLTPIA
jgi:hypothetical protein